jgi:competence protein ComEA
MIKQLIAVALALCTGLALAGVDANKASQAELEAVKGIGPGLAGRILAERQKGGFKDWADLSQRVKGVGERNAAKLSANGLTVGEAAFQPGPAAAAPARPAKAGAKNMR